jgi:DNA-directed RNA polymerase I, II, and III subunit RPABC2
MAEKTVFEIEGGDDESDYSDSDAGSETSDIKEVAGGHGSDYDDDEDEDEEDIENTFDEDDDENAEKEINQTIDFSDDEDDDDDDYEEENNNENYLQKFNETLKTNVIADHHPELIVQNFLEVDALCTIVRNEDGIIIDPLHRTVPFVTKYEKAKVLGERAKQINSGAETFVEIGDEIVDGYLIALAEFEQKKLPMIVRRPLPNGGSEFWRLADLEIL